jgi:repressor LexA
VSNTLTARQLEILVMIDRFTREKGYPPTHREIAREHGILGTNAIADHLCRLEVKGMVRRHPYTCRGLVLTDAARALLAQPGAEAP